MHKYIQLTINTSKSCYIVEGNSRNLFASIFLDVHWYFWNYASILITIFSQFNCYCSCYSNQENLIIILPHCYVETQENYCHKSYTSHLFVERRYSLHLLRENVSLRESRSLHRKMFSNSQKNYSNLQHWLIGYVNSRV